MEINKGELRLLPMGNHIYSINNQMSFTTDKEVIVEVVSSTTFELNAVFVKPKQLVFNIIGYVPFIIGLGSDEWLIDYSKTTAYEVPKPEGFIRYKSSAKE